MTGNLAGLIAEAVDSQTKLELVAYFIRNPYAAESLSGLTARLGRDPGAMDLAIRELTAAGFLRAAGADGFCPQTVFSLDRDDPRAALWQDLEAAYSGEDRGEILRLVAESDRLSAVRRAAADHRLHDLQTRFLAMVSDQLRNPVSTIMGLVVSLLTQRDRLSPSQVHSLELIEQHSQVLIRLVEDLLLGSRLDDGDLLPLNPSLFDLVSLVREIESDFATENTDHLWSLDVPAEPLLIEADRGQLRQVFGVLVRNALKFTPAGTRIVLCVGEDAEQVWGAVEDEGPGLTPADQARMFDMFYQGETDATRLSGGLGLGLYLARVIVEAHGGGIAAEPKSGPGLRVVFRLPRPAPPAAGEDPR